MTEELIRNADIIAGSLIAINFILLALVPRKRRKYVHLRKEVRGANQDVGVDTPGFSRGVTDGAHPAHPLCTPPGASYARANQGNHGSPAQGAGAPQKEKGGRHARVLGRRRKGRIRS